VKGRAHWALAVAAAAGGIGELTRRRRSARSAPPLPMTTQSSPGQIADLQQTYGAEMTPEAATAPSADTADG
jgi:hypothetical protein